jgi:hypothetical protein
MLEGPVVIGESVVNPTLFVKFPTLLGDALSGDELPDVAAQRCSRAAAETSSAGVASPRAGAPRGAARPSDQIGRRPFPSRKTSGFAQRPPNARRSSAGGRHRAGEGIVSLSQPCLCTSPRRACAWLAWLDRSFAADGHGSPIRDRILCRRTCGGCGADRQAV